MPIKVLYDIEQLALLESHKSGVFRVADALFKAFLASSRVDVYPCMTRAKGSAKEYFKSINRPELGQKLVMMQGLCKTTKYKNCFQRCLSRLWTLFYCAKYTHILKQYDWYFSPFSPISDVVYKSPIKTAMFVHDLIPVLYPEFVSPKFHTKFCQWIKCVQANLVFVNSLNTKKDFLACRTDFDAARIIVSYLAADKLFHPVQDKNKIDKIRQKYHIHTPRYFLTVSAFSRRKNFAHLIQAFELFLSYTGAEDISLVLAGSARDKKDKLFIITNDNKRKIVFTGFVDDKDMPALYSGAEAFLYPSLYEGFGLPILEAMQCGAPVVSANNSSLPEVSKNAALYVSACEPLETALTMVRLYNDPKLKSDMKRKSLSQAKSFNSTDFASSVIDGLCGSVEQSCKTQSAFTAVRARQQIKRDFMF